MTSLATSALTSDQRRFIEEFLIDLSATAAARRMGIEEQEAREAGSHLLRVPEVTKAIGEELAARVVANSSLPTVRSIVLSALMRRIAMIEALKVIIEVLAFRRGYLVKRIDVSDLYGCFAMSKEMPDSVIEVLQAHHHDHCFYCYGLGPISHRILTGGDWDAHLKEILREEASRYRTGTVVEVGANIGASFLPLCGEMSHLHFVMFEPNPAFYQILERNKESFQLENVELLPYAVSDGESDELLLLTDDVSGGVNSAGAFVGRYSPVVSKATSLDQHFVGENVILIKIDVDGFELDVLRGAEGLIRRCRPRACGQ